MIQLASQSNASRTAWQPAPTEGQGTPADPRRGRGHAWPFISRHGEKPAAQPAPKTHTGDSGS